MKRAEDLDMQAFPLIIESPGNQALVCTFLHFVLPKRANIEKENSHFCYTSLPEGWPLVSLQYIVLMTTVVITLMNGGVAVV